jgi:DNA-binding NarL/FixJ family response regulator
VRVVIADDSVIVREGLRSMLRAEGVETVGEASEPAGLLRLVALERPDAAIVDIRMPPTHTDEGIAAAEQIRAQYPGTAVLVLSQYVAATYAQRLLEDGTEAVGYLLKERVSEAPLLVDALKRVVAGECVVDPELVIRLMSSATAAGPLTTLSDRERDVLALMAEGRSNEAIASSLHVGLKTVETHVAHILRKLGIAEAPAVNRRVAAVVALLRNGPTREPT